ncbi:MAG: hypothetical protein JST92_18995 [Deltaproteobacteria bacterium]|nr:hypothetical protein [Deltaproteobacteria bacterium]
MLDLRALWTEPPFVANARARTNHARLRILSPILTAIHAVNVIVFGLGTQASGSERAWANHVAAAHACAGVSVLAVWLLGGYASSRKAPKPSVLPDLLGLGYILFAAVLAAIDQAITQSVTPYLVAAFGVGLVVRLRRGPLVVSYTVGLVVFAVLQARMQPLASVALSNQVNGFSITLVGLGAAWGAEQSFRRERLLEELLSICSYCHSIRNQDGKWEPVEQYVGRHADVAFSHGICEGCYQKQFGGTPAA